MSNLLALLITVEAEHDRPTSVALTRVAAPGRDLARHVIRKNLTGGGVPLIQINCSRQLTDRFSELVVRFRKQLFDACAFPSGQMTPQHRVITIDGHLDDARLFKHCRFSQGEMEATSTHSCKDQRRGDQNHPNQKLEVGVLRTGKRFCLRSDIYYVR